MKRFRSHLWVKTPEILQGKSSFKKPITCEGSKNKICTDYFTEFYSLESSLSGNVIYSGQLTHRVNVTSVIHERTKFYWISHSPEFIDQPKIQFLQMTFW